MRYLIAAAFLLAACTGEPMEPAAAPAPVKTVVVTATPEPQATVTVIEREVAPSPSPSPEPAPQAQAAEPVYVAPDPATVAQYIKGVFRERLERDPDQAELSWHVDWYMAEDRQGGDTRARWMEMFEREYAGEMEFLADKQKVQERRQRQQECRENYYQEHGEPAPGYMCIS